MASVVRFIERLYTHLKDRFPEEDNKLCLTTAAYNTEFQFWLKKVKTILK